jgi:hypothetical protein
MVGAGITRPIMEITIAEEASLPDLHKTLAGSHPTAVRLLRRHSSGSSKHRQKRRILRRKKSTARTKIKTSLKTDPVFFGKQTPSATGAFVVSAFFNFVLGSVAPTFGDWQYGTKNERPAG